METEKQIEEYLVRKVRQYKGKAYKFVSPGNVGVPDRLVVLPGMLMFVELKTAKGRLTKMQEVQIQRLRDLNQDVYIIRSKKQVDELLEFYENIIRKVDSVLNGEGF